MANKSKLLQLAERHCAIAINLEDQLAKERIEVGQLSTDLKARSSQVDELQFELQGMRPIKPIPHMLSLEYGNLISSIKRYRERCN